MTARRTRIRDRSPSEVILGEDTLRIPADTGLLEDRDLLPGIRLLASHAKLQPGERVLVAPCGGGLLTAWAAKVAASGESRIRVTGMDTNLLATNATHALLAANAVSDATVRVGLPDRSEHSFDVFLMPLPKGRDLARMWLLHGALATRRGGRIVIAGPNSGGIQSFARDAALLLGEGVLGAYKAGSRVFEFHLGARPSEDLPDLFCSPGLRSGSYRTYSIRFAGRDLTVCTRPGVFSRDGLDEGTRCLIDALSVLPDDDVLDLGCGAGVIGMASAIMAPSAQITLVDVDALAIECAAETLRRNGIDRAKVLLSDGFSATRGRRYSLILTNPPFHAGHGVSLLQTERFIGEAHERLLPGGRLVLVANRFLPYASLLQQVYGSVEVLASTSKFCVYSATRVQA